MGDSIIIAVSLAILVALSYGAAYWASRAQFDRSARVGLYLVLGFPGGLLAIYGLARVVNGEESGAVWLATGLGLMLPLMPNVRRVFGRLTPMNESSAIDMVGLSLLLGIGGFLALSYAVQPDPEDAGSVALADLISQFSAFTVLAYVLVGVGIWRSFPEATMRLGLTWPSKRQVVAGIGGFFIGMVVMVVAGVLTTIFQPDFNEEINQATQGITESVSNPLGAAFFGLGAGISEELLLRGAIQPRYGLIMTSVLFALLHNQYGISFILAGVFSMGIILGLERKYFGTTAAIITHAIF
ncbi:MAG: lysostaphin resistance A-like protein, partial [Thermomicrobiales bacterium]